MEIIMNALGHQSPLGMAATSLKVLISSFLKRCAVNGGHIMAFYSASIHFGEWCDISLYFKMCAVDFLLAATHLCLFKYWGHFNQGIHEWGRCWCCKHTVNYFAGFHQQGVWQNQLVLFKSTCLILTWQQHLQDYINTMFYWIKWGLNYSDYVTNSQQ